MQITRVYVCPFFEIGFPHPLSRKRVCLPPWTKRGEQHSLAGEGVEDPITTTEQKAWHSVYSVPPYILTIHMLLILELL
jgi:hypothetical protein